MWLRYCGSCTGPRTAADMFYRLMRAVAWVILKVLYRLEVAGRENIPVAGPVVMAVNHQSYLDPVLVGLLSTRPVHFMAKSELWGIPLMGLAVEALKAFPVRRGRPDIGSVKRAIALLRAGEVLGLFPEGTRIRGRSSLGPAQAGVALVAIDGQALVVPVGITGTERVVPEGRWFPRFPKLRVTAGRPISTDGYTTRRSDLHRLTDEIMGQIAALSGREAGS